MQNKIIGIVICILLISSTTTLALTPFWIVDQHTKNQFVQKSLLPLPPPQRWMTTFGGVEGDLGASVQQTTDGGYIIAGCTNSSGAGGSDVWLIKTNESGKQMWNKTFGGIGWDEGMSVQQTNDGGYIIAATTNSFGAGLFDIWLIKTNSNGNKSWDRTFGGIYYDFSFKVQQTTDGGYVISGSSNSYDNGYCDFLLIKTNSNGDLVWNKTFGGAEAEWGYSSQQTTDGGYIIVGYTGSFGAGFFDIWLIKTDGEGNKIWDKTFGDTGLDVGTFVQQTTDGGYIIIGETESETTFCAWLIKTDSNGNKIWDNTFSSGLLGVGYSCQQTTDGGYIITGYKQSIIGHFDVWLTKTDSGGNKVWDRAFGGTKWEIGYSVDQTTDDGYIITGSTQIPYGDCDVLLIKTDNQGKSKTTSLDNLWLRLFHRFPNEFPILRKPMGY